MLACLTSWHLLYLGARNRHGGNDQIVQSAFLTRPLLGICHARSCSITAHRVRPLLIEMNTRGNRYYFLTIFAHCHGGR